MMYALPEYSLSRVDVIHQMDALSLLRGLAAGSVDAIITDMPYGTTACSWDTVINLAAWWGQVKRVLKPRGVFVTTAAQPFTSALVMSNPAWFRYEWIWLKENGSDFLNAKRKPFEAHENIAVFYNRQPVYNPQMIAGAPYRAISGTAHRSGLRQPNVADGTTTINSGVRYPKTYLYFNTVKGMHPTQKPVALYEYLIKTYTRPGELVLDPFSGSGTTAIAARMTGRHFICGDSSREYVEMSRKRLADTDPYQHKQVGELKQKSLFAEMSL